MLDNRTKREGTGDMIDCDKFTAGVQHRAKFSQLTEWDSGKQSVLEKGRCIIEEVYSRSGRYKKLDGEKI